MTQIRLEKESRLHDPVYGPVILDEPLLIDLYRSEAVQRLDLIYQGGITAFINPARRTATVYRPATDIATLTEDDDLDGQDVLPGFRCRVAELFLV
jgi:hypothetical protein